MAHQWRWDSSYKDKIGEINMATGRLGVSAIPATTNTIVYTVPTGYYAVANVSITNRNTSAISIRVALSTTSSPNLQEWLEFDTVMVPNGVFERTGLVMQAGLNIVVYATSANVGCTVYGIETATT
jgi:hypothetical protein